MTKEKKESLLRKLAKLIEHEKSAKEIGSVNEAEAFAVRIQELLLEVQIKKLDDTDPIREEMFDPFDHDLKRSRRVKWQERLANVLSSANSCKHLIIPGSNLIVFVGRDSDRKTVIYLYGMLARLIESESQLTYWREYKTAQRKERRGEDPWATKDLKGFRQSWISGAIFGLTQRFMEKKKEMVNTDEKRALILCSEQKVQDFVDQISTGKAKTLSGRHGFNEDGFDSGKKWGSSVSINPGVDSGGKGQKRLTS